jgi:hypothetical protein
MTYASSACFVWPSGGAACICLIEDEFPDQHH